MSIHSFDDLDDMFEQMRKDQEAADCGVSPWQAAIKPGDYVARPGPGCFVYSDILPDPEPREEGLRHYRFTRSYSVFCPKGELGDIHVSTIERTLSAEKFQAIKANGWR